MLHVELHDEVITITLPIKDLKFAVQASPFFEHYDEESGEFLEPKITNSRAFADDVVRELVREEEDGTTIVHKMFDQAFENAVDQGAEGIVLPSDKKDYAEAVAE
jgi:hypothetical protein